jgi:hypothetical protein
VREPDLPSDDKEPGMRLVGSELAEALTSGQPHRLVFSEADLNGYIRQTLRAKPGNDVIPGFVFKRAFIQLEPGNFWIGMEHRFYDYPLFSRVKFKPVAQNGRVQPELQGGSFGRLSVPKFLMEKLGFVFDGLWKGLKRDEANLKRISQITVEKGRVQIVTPGAAPVAPAAPTAPSVPAASPALSQPGSATGSSPLGQPHLSEPPAPSSGKPLPPPPPL